VVVEEQIVDRASVPSALYDKDWIAYQQAGQVGTTARILLPGEMVIGADAGLVASYAFTRDTEGSDHPDTGPNGVTIMIRDIKTGAIIRTLDTPVIPRDGLMVGDRLFWFGNADSIEAPKGSDVAVWAFDLGDPASKPIKLAPGESGLASSPLRLSDGGRVVMRNLGGLADGGVLTQVIDVSTMSVTTIRGEIVYSLAGERAVVNGGEDRLVVRDLRTGDRVGAPLDAYERYKTYGSKGEVFIQFGHFKPERGVYIKAIDLRTGEIRDVLFQPQGVPTSFMSPELSTPEVLVLFDERDDWEYDANGFAYGTFSLLDPATGTVQADAFTITPPAQPRAT
jgi:hypothetical protein